jgi:two-component system phosphate regulon sensor histidine kinase PhoR
LSPVYRAAAGTLIAIALPAVLAGAVAGPAWGFGLATTGLMLLVAYHVRHLARLSRWLAQPLPGKVPEGIGSWDEVLAALHRFERDAAGQQAAVAESLARFLRAAQALPDGVVILNEANRIEWCNPTAEALLQLDGRRDLGQPIANLIRDPQFLAYLSAEDPLEHQPAQVQAEAGLILSLQIIPYGEDRKLLLARDMTEAERVATMRRDFVANVSHELRTPLTVLVGFLETVRELKLDPQHVRDYLGMMREQAARMHRIIEDLLTLSVLESAPLPGTERVCIAPLLMRLRVEAEALSGGRHAIRVDATPTRDLVGAESELSGAFSNLVSNAVRYTPAGGTITLRWADGTDGAEFSVEDTGLGIAPEHIPRLTERFYRVDRSRSRETGGTGLGLAIVKHAVARHQATLDIESRQPPEPNAGSRFTVRFPPERVVPAEPSTVTSAG